MTKSEMIVSLLLSDLMTVRHLSTYIWPYTIIVFLLTPRCACVCVCFLHCSLCLNSTCTHGLFRNFLPFPMSNNNKIQQIHEYKRSLFTCLYNTVLCSKLVAIFGSCLFIVHCMNGFSDEQSICTYVCHVCSRVNEETIEERGRVGDKIQVS